MKKTLSVLLAVAILITTVPCSSVHANPLVGVGASQVASYVSYILTLLGFKLYDSALNKWFLGDYMSMMTIEQCNDIADYLDSCDDYSNVEIRPKDINMFSNFYLQLYGTVSGLSDLIIGDNYSVNFDTTKDIELSNGLVGQVHKDKFWYRDYIDDKNWSSRLRKRLFGKDSKSETLEVKESWVLRNAPWLYAVDYDALPAQLDYRYGVCTPVQRDKEHIDYNIKYINRDNGVKTIEEETRTFATYQSGNWDLRIYYITQYYTGQDCIAIARYLTDSRNWIWTDYIPIEAFKWKFLEFDVLAKCVDILYNNNYIVQYIKNLLSQGKKLYADLTSVGLLDGAIVEGSDKFDWEENKIKYPPHTLGELGKGIKKGYELLFEKQRLSKLDKAIKNKYSINGMVADTTWQGANDVNTVEEGENTNTGDTITDLAGLGNGIIALQQLLSKIQSNTQSQAVALEAIKNMNFNNKNHKYEQSGNKNLLDKFPFCLPKDVHLLLNIFSAEPKKPVFNVRLLNNTITLDFTQFEALAGIVRIAITISFIYGLIVLTKGVIQ